jgi:uncharacterized RDD family membrane protein YckC
MDYAEYVAYEPILARRCFAAIVDYGLYFAIVFAITIFFGNPRPDGLHEFKGYGNMLILFLIWLVLIPGVESVLGYTLGKGLLDLKVVRERKTDFPPAVALKRHIFDFIDFFFFGAVAIILVKVSKDHKRIGDRLAHTHVVLEK